jgi:pyocin large subunit-like protein
VAIPAPSRRDLRSPDRGTDHEPRWLVLMRAADAEIIAARRYWRETTQTSSPSLLAAIAEEDAIKAKHAGGRT